MDWASTTDGRVNVPVGWVSGSTARTKRQSLRERQAQKIHQGVGEYQRAEAALAGKPDGRDQRERDYGEHARYTLVKMTGDANSGAHVYRVRQRGSVPADVDSSSALILSASAGVRGL
jgi:hypothetical protein